MKNNIGRIAPIVCLLLVAALLSACGGRQAIEAGAEATGKQRFEWVVTKRLTVENNAVFNGDLKLEGNELYWDADEDTYSAASTDDQLEMTIGGAAGFMRVKTGNLRVGDGTPNVTPDGEDAYIEGMLDVDGAAYIQGNVSDYDGVFTIADNAIVDGQADAVQLTVQGYTTQTNDIFVVENSGATDLLTVDGSGNVDVAGDVTIAGNLEVADQMIINVTTIISEAVTITDTLTMGSYIDMAGHSIVLDADADTTIVASDDDVITITLGAATGDVIIATGNLQIGDGTPGQTINGDDLYVKGLAEVDGVAYLDGGADLNGTTLTIDADADTTLVASDDDVISATLGAATGSLKVLTGNLEVGDGTPDVALDGEDAYVVGTLEVDGAIRLDGAIDANSTLDVSSTSTLVGLVDAQAGVYDSGGDLALNDNVAITGTLDVQGGDITMQNDETLSNATDGTITATVAADGFFWISTGNLEVGEGTPDQTLNGEDAYIVGLLEVDGVAYLDGGIDLNGATLTIDADADTTLVASDDDVISATLGATTGSFKVLTGNLEVGDGTPGQTLNGEDAYIVGLLEVDGVVYLDGGADFNGTALTIDADADTTLVASDDDVISATLGAATGSFKVLTGNLEVGDGTPDLTLNGEDAYIVGTLEADGAARFDAGVTIGAGDLTIANGAFLPDFADLTVSDGDTITPTASIYALDTSGNVTITLAASGTEGQSVTIIIDDDGNTVIIADTNIRTSDGAAVSLGDYDVVVFIFQDNEWLMVSKSTNS